MDQDEHCCAGVAVAQSDVATLAGVPEWGARPVTAVVAV
jgi:hypothetical protein